MTINQLLLVILFYFCPHLLSVEGTFGRNNTIVQNKQNIILPHFLPNITQCIKGHRYRRFNFERIHALTHSL